MIIKNTRNTLSETYSDALKIRNQVFVKEQGVPFNLEMASPIDEAAAVHFVLYDEAGKASATGRLLTHDTDSGFSVTLQRFAVLPEERGKGYAKQLILAMLDFAREHKFSEIILHAQLTARGFYEKFGFASEGEVFEEAGIRHITMKRTITG